MTKVKGADSAEELLKAKVTDPESLDAIEKAMKKTQTEASTNQRSYSDKVEKTVGETTKALGIY